MGQLRKNRRRFDGGISSHNDPAPTDGVTNLADAMLVFACGLLISVILNWNLDISIKKVDISADNQAVNIEDFDEMTESEAEDSLYQEMGKVYVDSATGELYMVVEDGEKK